MLGGTDILPHDARQPSTAGGDKRDRAVQGFRSSILQASFGLAARRLATIPHNPFNLTLVGQA